MKPTFSKLGASKAAAGDDMGNQAAKCPTSFIFINFEYFAWL
jgi:hypothetical protein